MDFSENVDSVSSMIHVERGMDYITLMCVCAVVKRDIQDSDEEAVRVKEQSILELGGLLAKTGQAAGEQSIMLVF